MEIARLIAMLAGGWLVGVGLLMVVAPRRCLNALAAAGSSRVVHFGELVPRVFVGVALVLIAPRSCFPFAMSTIGWLLVVSGVVLMALPMRWHSAYSRWWAERIPETAVRLLGAVSVLAGAALIWCLI